MTKSVLLTGASGTVGFETLKELLRRKGLFTARILVLNRPFERKFFRSFREQTEIIFGDIRDPQIVFKAVEDMDVIIHAAGIIPPLADENPELAKSVNIDGTRNIIDALNSQRKKPRIIFTSSIAVYGDRLRDPEIVVGDPLIPSDGDEYAKTKIIAEEIIKGADSWSILRLCGVLSKHLRIHPIMFHMPLNTSLEWCSPSDVGFALVEAIDRHSIFGRVYNLGGGEKCRIIAKEFINKMFSLWGLDMAILPEYAFALQNFHSGYYQDGHLLNEILNFQSTSLNDYFNQLQSKMSPVKRLMVRAIPRFVIKRWMLKMSEPLKSIRDNNEYLIKRFYGSSKKFYQLL